ncbi:MAG: hypothetical protein MJ082_05595, partial [Clostridia bacterium]|nr:hypothetical protein [Clostridia bacterium]
IRDARRTNEGVRFKEKRGKPIFPLKEKESRLTVGAQYIDGPSRDNGYLMGTKFYGTIKEKNGYTKIVGIIITEPFLHLLWAGLIGFFVYSCLQKGGISIWPICLAVMGLFLFYGEYEKQGLIKRFLHRAVSRAERENRTSG